MKTAFFLFVSLVSLTFGSVAAQCTVGAAGDPSSGTLITTDFSYVNCHRYIRTALLNGGVNMNTGDFVSNPTIHPDATSIASDPRFVIVCTPGQAEAICFTHLSGQPDHSALVLPNPGIITGALGSFASTPGPGSALYSHGEASIGSGGGTLMNYFGVVPEIQGSSTIDDGDTETYCVPYKSYMTNVSWSVSSGGQIVSSSNSFCIDITANCSASTTPFTLSFTFTVSGTGETRTITKEITPDCPFQDPCNNNTINGNTLYTFNYVAPFMTHTIQMGTNWSWSIQSGTPLFFQVTNNGQTVQLRISNRGCVVLRAYNSSCGSRTYIFCPNFRSKSGDAGKDELNQIVAGNLVDMGGEPFQLFPNPARTSVEVRVNSNDYRIRLFTLTGALTAEYNNSTRIDLTNIQPGTYLVEVFDRVSQQQSFKRLVKQ